MKKIQFYDMFCLIQFTLQLAQIMYNLYELKLFRYRELLCLKMAKYEVSGQIKFF